uniref:Putative secreted peptide n=1 Tax=Anopheles braziliensis TaxID=58242 RepID=A0A2M3ZXD6_9DIPT
MSCDLLLLIVWRRVSVCVRVCVLGREFAAAIRHTPFRNVNRSSIIISAFEKQNHETEKKGTPLLYARSLLPLSSAV